MTMTRFFWNCLIGNSNSLRALLVIQTEEVISVTGLILPEVPGEFMKHNLPELQKSVILETCRIVRKIIKRVNME